MNSDRKITIPTLVRIKPGAFERVGVYAARHGLRRAVVLFSSDLPAPLCQRLEVALRGSGVEVVKWEPISEPSFEQAQAVFGALPSDVDAIFGVGGGKALETAKHLLKSDRTLYQVFSD